MIPIGTACENKQVLLLDEDLRPVSPGQPGEICVRGIGLSLGYYGEDEKTRQAFVQRSHESRLPGSDFTAPGTSARREKTE